MILPLQADILQRRRPIATISIISLCILVYIIQMTSPGLREFIFENGIATAPNLRIWSVVTCLFLHADLSHLAGNMLFLWIFGSSVEQRYGSKGLSLLFIGSGSLAALATLYMGSFIGFELPITNQPRSVLGASGGVCAITASFVTLFPTSRIRILYIFFLIGIAVIPAWWIVALYLALDIFGQLQEALPGVNGNVAYLGHLTGYISGFTATFWLLKNKNIQGNPDNLLFRIEQSQRRRRYRESLDINKNQTPIKEQIKNSNMRKFHAAKTTSELLDSIKDLNKNELNSISNKKIKETANTFLNKGHVKEAIQCYRIFLENYPNDPDAGSIAVLTAAQMIRKTKDYDSARLLLESFAKPINKNKIASSIAKEITEEIPN